MLAHLAPWRRSAPRARCARGGHRARRRRRRRDRRPQCVHRAAARRHLALVLRLSPGAAATLLLLVGAQLPRAALCRPSTASSVRRRPRPPSRRRLARARALGADGDGALLRRSRCRRRRSRSSPSSASTGRRATPRSACRPTAGCCSWRAQARRQHACAHALAAPALALLLLGSACAQDAFWRASKLEYERARSRFHAKPPPRRWRCCSRRRTCARGRTPRRRRRMGGGRRRCTPSTPFCTHRNVSAPARPPKTPAPPCPPQNPPRRASRTWPCRGLAPYHDEVRPRVAPQQRAHHGARHEAPKVARRRARPPQVHPHPGEVEPRRQVVGLPSKRGSASFRTKGHRAEHQHARQARIDEPHTCGESGAPSGTRWRST